MEGKRQHVGLAFLLWDRKLTLPFLLFSIIIKKSAEAEIRLHG